MTAKTLEDLTPAARAMLARNAPELLEPGAFAAAQAEGEAELRLGRQEAFLRLQWYAAAQAGQPVNSFLIRRGYPFSPFAATAASFRVDAKDRQENEDER
ncbi:hypothetical protein BBC27_06560 [Acidithiobacillus ferrivorans]|uniref:Uncharacterized protein n=1 Tax=Acidithiobacillus ferrivorans TaxID=160808 RepID=A0A1B9C1C3_9PROT|nr:hypothetical protein [Acidithiobacillus ferrivorans]OCB03741.1 hypothetical protein BBC27_06560 [Acidithiobacillus ferrivorans]